MSIIKRYGDQMVIVMDDGKEYLAYPSATDIWIVKNKPSGDDGGGGDPPPSGGKFMWPFNPKFHTEGGAVSSEYGYRPQYGRWHQGIDFGYPPATAGAKIPAAGNGKVYRNSYNSGFGNHVILQHEGNIFTVYGHMVRRSSLNVGQSVKMGQTIGNIGNTGNSYGAHLHWETHVGGLSWSNPGTHMNPREFMEQYAK